MKRNKYKSNENTDQGVSIDLWNSDCSRAIGAIAIRGATEIGYHLVRTGRIGEFGSGDLADCGVFFERRKDAENYALVVSMIICGDITNRELLDPEIFSGKTRNSYFKNYLKSKRELFWTGANKIKTEEGWDQLDPDHLLDQISDPSDFSYFDDDFEVVEVVEDAIEIHECANTIYEYYKEHFLTQQIEQPYLDIANRLILKRSVDLHEDVISVQKRSFTMLLGLSKLKGKLPVDWIFPHEKSLNSSTIMDLWNDLPDDVVKFLEKQKSEREQNQRIKFLEQETLGKIKAKIKYFNKFPSDLQAMMKFSAYFHSIAEVDEYPQHSNSVYSQVATEFHTRALNDEDDAIAWIVGKMKHYLINREKQEK